MRGVFVSFLVGLALPVFGSVPHTINYQGMLTDSSGNAVDTSVSIVFSVYSDSTGGSAIWTETHPSVEVRDGVFNVMLGSVNPIPKSIFSQPNRWLGVKVGNDPELTPREAISSVAYSYITLYADSAGHALVTDSAIVSASAYTVMHADSADYADTAGYAIRAGKSDSAVYADTASWTLGGGGAAYADSAGHAIRADSALYADSAGYADTAGYAFRAGWADSAGHAVYADTASYASTIVSYAQVFTVAQAGGDFTTISAALAACVGASQTNPYLVRVMPGTYTENVTMISFVGLQGAGKYVTYINGSVIGASSAAIDGFNISGGIVCSGTSPFITHNIISNDEGDGISINEAGTPWIKENEIINCSKHGISCNGWGCCPWIIANRIQKNANDGIYCDQAGYPIISNNKILENGWNGIKIIGVEGYPAEPTIDDNVIGNHREGAGIWMIGYAEPKIIANNIRVNMIGIEINEYTRPSIIGNDINYNTSVGILSSSSALLTIKSNHIHDSWYGIGINVTVGVPVITHNNITSNATDIQYAGGGASAPNISLNVYDVIVNPGTGATGVFNVMSTGALAPGP